MTIEEQVLRLQAGGRPRSPKKNKKPPPDLDPPKKSPRDAPEAPGKSIIKPGPLYILEICLKPDTPDDAQPDEAQPGAAFTHFLEKDLLQPADSESPGLLTENSDFQDSPKDADIYKLIAEKTLHENIGKWENMVARSGIEKKKSSDAEG
jgi:hypothetical protein